jgi:hypothetical protein
MSHSTWSKQHFLKVFPLFYWSDIHFPFIAKVIDTDFLCSFTSYSFLRAFWFVSAVFCETTLGKVTVASYIPHPWWLFSVWWLLTTSTFKEVFAFYYLECNFLSLSYSCLLPTHENVGALQGSISSSFSTVWELIVNLAMYYGLHCLSKTHGKFNCHCNSIKRWER